MSLPATVLHPREPLSRRPRQKALRCPFAATTHCIRRGLQRPPRRQRRRPSGLWFREVRVELLRARAGRTSCAADAPRRKSSFIKRDIHEVVSLPLLIRSSFRWFSSSSHSSSVLKIGQLADVELILSSPCSLLFYLSFVSFAPIHAFSTISVAGLMIHILTHLGFVVFHPFLI